MAMFRQLGLSSSSAQRLRQGMVSQVMGTTLQMKKLSFPKENFELCPGLKSEQEPSPQ